VSLQGTQCPVLEVHTLNRDPQPAVPMSGPHEDHADEDFPMMSQLSLQQHLGKGGSVKYVAVLEKL
jgi:hypothetical protein